MNNNKFEQYRKDMSELFEIHEREGPLFPFPLNIDFKYRKEIENFSWGGPGIYLIFYKKELIYIGSYVSTGEKSNVLKVRWWTHLASVTMRGAKIGFGKNSKWDKRIRYFKEGELKKIFQDKKECFESRLKETGCVTTEKRIHYACANWDDFKIFNKNTLADFEVQYFRILHPGYNAKQLLHDIEFSLIRELNPKCNKQYNEKMPNVSGVNSINRTQEVINQFF